MRCKLTASRNVNVDKVFISGAGLSQSDQSIYSGTLGRRGRGAASVIHVGVMSVCSIRFSERLTPDSRE